MCWTWSLSVSPGLSEDSGGFKVRCLGLHSACATYHLCDLGQINLSVLQCPHWLFVKVDLLRSEFSFAVNGEYNYDTYAILYKDAQIAEVEKDKTWKTLNLYLANVENITIKIKKSGNEVKSFRLEQTEAGMGHVLSIAKE